MAKTNPSGTNNFINKESAGGVLLLIMAIAAIVWANSALGGSYFALWTETKFTIGIGDAALSKPLILWINDLLMAIFFLVVGLEIKREIMVGELSSLRKASLPIAAAVGGMVIPALFYVGFNKGGPGASGWGIPMATDIAFSLGILALLGSRAPAPLKIFLTALAIADDLGAIMVIAIFYTAQLDIMSLLSALAILAVLVGVAKLGIRNVWVFILPGVVVWFFFLKSGVHATISGVLLAFVIPVRTKIDTEGFANRMAGYLKQFRENGEPGNHILKNPERQAALHHMRETADQIETPLEKIEHALLPIVSFAIMPIFALANAGVAIGSGGLNLTDPVFLGVVTGLFLGKPVGILFFTVVAVKSGIATLPAGVNYAHILGAGLLAGVGFTMSLFIGNLAFTEADLLESAKLGILVGSLISALAGVGVLMAASKK
ncbi:MAG: Na+/H+ antiporter NhaA [Leptospirales bacterium]|jgi:NhaA family Na+:H+ antiporter